MSTVFLEEHDIKREVIVTGEAVELEIRPASIMARVAGAIVDAAFSLILLFLLVSVAGDAMSRITDRIALDTTSKVLVRLSMVAAFMLLPGIVEAFTHGRSLGKILAGTRVVRDDGGIISAPQAFIRSIVWLVEGWTTLGSVAMLTATLSKRGKRLGDMTAGTYVVSVHVNHNRASLVMPPQLTQWASHASFAPLPTNLSNSISSFLRNASMLNPGVRTQTATQLAHEAEAYVAPAPPEGTPPEHFLAAVSVARRDIEYRTESSQRRAVSQARARAQRIPYDLAEPKSGSK
ncbi:RDD family protein [Boudabousia marimammalium]|uniref:RDD domain-containing protein n=1 Tax=Boudabousia marimammalium TaxID=156892 RepID=A0A1Q5PRG5_9ACTO|nr:RDD family protein [Boudabousia marimammalium]OKL50208.1 hypothetical protein BM477_02100 [Boudabousia marimammalium]